MTESKIPNFFTPLSASRVKRSKPDSSPELRECEREPAAVMEDEKVGELTRGQLMGDMTAILSNLLDQKLVNLATKNDIGIVSRKITNLEQENALLKTEIVRLRDHEKQVMSKLTDLESRSRRNNLIFKGLNLTGSNPDCRYLVRQFCLEELGCDNSLWVNRAHPLGRERSLVIAHIPQDEDIEHILSRAYLVKNKGYAVFRDLPVEIRRKRALLFAVRQEVERICGRRRMPVDFDHLRINGVRFTWEEDGLKAGTQDGAEKLRELFNRDFRAFLSTLKDRGPKLARPGEGMLSRPTNGGANGVSDHERGTTTKQSEIAREPAAVPERSSISTER